MHFVIIIATFVAQDFATFKKHQQFNAVKIKLLVIREVCEI